MLKLEHPNFLYLLLLIPLFILIFWYYMSWKKRKLALFGDMSLVSRLVPEFSPARYWFKAAIFSTALLFLIMGMANPQIGSKLEEVKRKGVDLVIALDVSNSMMAEDIKPNRLARAKMAISRLIDRLESDRLGLVIFAGKAFTQLPITHDHAAAKMFLSSISPYSIDVQGTAIGVALEHAFKCFEENKYRNKAIIVISDGENHEDDPIGAAQMIANNGVFIHTIGIGSPDGAPIPEFSNNRMTGYKKDASGHTVMTKLDEATLRKIASIGNGTYTRATNIDIGLDKIFDDIKEMEKQQYESKVFSSYESRFQYFIGLAILLLILEMIISNKKSKWLNSITLFDIKK